MPTILIVDDSATDRRLAGGLLGQIDEMNIEYAVDGGDALLKMELHVPDIVVTDLDGTAHRLPALEGWRVMEIIKDAGQPLKAECGGALECATCHVYVAPSWLARLHPRSSEEEEKLDEAFLVKSNSRLSCQILMSDELNGLEVTLAPEG